MDRSWFSNPSVSVGILVCLKRNGAMHGEGAFCRRLSQIGRRIGLRVFAFTPEDIRWDIPDVEGRFYCPDTGNWSKRRCPLPSIVYDRFFSSCASRFTAYRSALAKLAGLPGVQLLGRALNGKQQVQQALDGCPELRPHLPPTRLYRGAARLLPLLEAGKPLFLKPNAGSQGKGALHIMMVEREITVRGRDRRNGCLRLLFADRSAWSQWLDSFIGRRTYVVQPFLDLRTSGGDAFDIRSLMQKNDAGSWELTGLAARRGQPGSVTSNLHGGGAAEPPIGLLAEQFGLSRGRTMLRRLAALSRLTAETLETRYGRLVELGIDFGIDSKGHIWILEVNSKPGRSAFSSVCDPTAGRRAYSRPLAYARYLSERQLGG